MNPLTEEQRRRVDDSMPIAYRIAKSAARKQRTHEHQIMSAAQEGLMYAAESYDRLDIAMPWDDWAAVTVNRWVTNYFTSRFARRLRRERVVKQSSERNGLDDFIDPQGESSLQMIDVRDLLAKIPTVKHAKLAHAVVFDRASETSAGLDSGFSQSDGVRAWDKVAHHLIAWGGGL